MYRAYAVLYALLGIRNVQCSVVCIYIGLCTVYIFYNAVGRGVGGKYYFFWLQSVSCSKDVRFALKANGAWSVPFM